MNPKVLGGLAAAGIGIYLFAPGVIGAAGPLLIVLACPVSMLLVMRGMAGGRQCETGSSGPQDIPEQRGQDGELTRLRAEVDQLRAELTDRQATRDR